MMNPHRRGLIGRFGIAAMVGSYVNPTFLTVGVGDLIVIVRAEPVAE
jgi:hypothetical protein